MPDLTTDNPLPATGPGSSYLNPHVCSLPVAIDIATNRGGPIIAQITTARGVHEVGKLWPDGRWEVSP